MGSALHLREGRRDSKQEQGEGAHFVSVECPATFREMRRLFVAACAALAAASAAQQAARRRRRRHLRAAPPKLGGGVEGFNIDLVNEAGRRMGRKVEIFAAEFSGLIPAMQAGKIDSSARPPLPQDARSNCSSPRVISSTYYQSSWPKQATSSRSTSSRQGVSSNKGSAYDKWLQDNSAKLGLKGAESYGTNADAMQAVISGRADAGLTGNTVAAYAVCG